MNLDDLDALRARDSRRRLAALDALPELMEAAWAQALAWPLPEPHSRPTAVVLAAVGSGALAAEMVAALVAGVCPMPLLVWREWGLPAFVGPETLVIALLPAGDEDEPRRAAQAAAERQARVLVLDRPADLPVSAATGPVAMLLLGLLTRLGLAATSAAEVAGAVAAVRAQQGQLGLESPVSANPAKRMAGQLMDRLPLIFAAAPLTAVAHYWQAQINRLGRAPAAAHATPDVAHLAVAGTQQPEALIRRYMVLALRSTFSDARADALTAQCRTAYMVAGFNTDEIAGTGPSALAHVFTALHYGDYAAYYLALCYGVDPSGE